MTKAEARTILEKQLTFLQEKSEACTDSKDIAVYTKLMYELYARMY